MSEPRGAGEVCAAETWRVFSAYRFIFSFGEAGCAKWVVSPGRGRSPCRQEAVPKFLTADACCNFRAERGKEFIWIFLRVGLSEGAARQAMGTLVLVNVSPPRKMQVPVLQATSVKHRSPAAKVQLS